MAQAVGSVDVRERRGRCQSRFGLITQSHARRAQVVLKNVRLAWLSIASASVSSVGLGQY